MASNLRAGVFAIFCLAFALPAAAQLNSAAIHVKWGSPFRETFHVPSGFDLIVDYGADNQVCRLQLPAPLSAAEKQRRYDFLAELVPLTMRGKELGSFQASTGANHSVLLVEYERVGIAEDRHAAQPDSDTITLTFKNENCQRPARAEN
jgi:hypothetical protein